MWPDSLRSHADAGCTRSPCCASTRVTGCCASQSICSSGSAARAARPRSRRRAARARARWATRGTAPSAVVAARTHVGARRAAAEPVDELRDQVVDLHRVARRRAVPRVLQQDQLPAGQLGEPSRRTPAGRMRSSVPCTTTTGHVTCRASGGDRLAHRARRTRSAPRSCPTSVCGVISCAQPTQSSICLVECGSENILREEELDEVVVAAAEPVVLVVLGPALGGVQRLVPRHVVAARRRPRPEPHDGAIAMMPEHPLGVLGGDVHRPRTPRTTR